MRFLLPVGGVVDHRFGILTAPTHKGVPLGIVEGMDWGADLGCLDGPAFVKRFDSGLAIPWLRETMDRYRETCLFIPAPDVVGDAGATLEAWDEWAGKLEGWPLAYIAQDGAECLPFPEIPEFGTVFVGGSTEWKLSEACYSVILRAQELGKRIHIGRVNWWKRYKHFRQMPGSEGWTCDGTRTRFDGTQRSIDAWADYMERGCQIRFSIPVGHCRG